MHSVFGETRLSFLRGQANPSGRRTMSVLADAEGRELIELQPQTLFLLDAVQIFRHILKPDVSQVLITFDWWKIGPQTGISREPWAIGTLSPAMTLRTR